MDRLKLDLPPWAAWVAMDRNGTWWCFEAEPNQYDHGWYENEIGRCQRLGIDPEPEKIDWRDSITKLKQKFNVTS